MDFSFGSMRVPRSPRTARRRTSWPLAFAAAACFVGCADDSKGKKGETGGMTDGTGTDDAATTSTDDATSLTDSSSSTMSDTTDDGSTTGEMGSCQDGLADPGEACYGPPIDLEKGISLGAVAIGDVDGDGHLDVVAGGETDIRVYLGDGAGTFMAQGPVPVSAAVLAIETKNVDGQAGDEVFVAIDQSEVLVFQGQAPLQNPLQLATGDEPGALVVAMLDEDTTQDLAVANTADGTVSVFTGDGAGNFSGWMDLTMGGAPSGIAAGTVDGDDNASLFVSNGGSDIVVQFPGTGVAFGMPVAHGVGLNPTWVAATDVDGDGVLDVTTVDAGDGAITWLPGLGDGSFDASKSALVGPEPRDGALGDLDGDGTVDLATVSRIDDEAQVLLADGDGGFYPVQTFAVRPGPRALASGDLNEDGVADLAVVSVGTGGGLVVLLSDI